MCNKRTRANDNVRLNQQHNPKGVFITGKGIEIASKGPYLPYRRFISHLNTVQNLVTLLFPMCVFYNKILVTICTKKIEPTVTKQGHTVYTTTPKKHTRPTNFCQLLSHFKTTIWRDATTQKRRVSSGKPVPKPTPNATDGRLSPKTVWVLLQNHGGLLVWRPWKRAVNVHKPRPKTSRSTHELNKLKYKSRSDTENTTCNHLAELRNCSVATFSPWKIMLCHVWNKTVFKCS